jgi:putative Ca2+/H+ antiporter (TMEM165/GDT1 family)
MDAFLASLALVTLAEMGDKTQLLAMAFATRFPARTVLLAVFLATFLNHALAVAAGRLLTTFVPLEMISLLAALSFILFGLWTLRGDTLQGEDKRFSGFGPLLTVAIAFFLAELGDKTQLATISLAVRYANPLGVLLGTTAGMIVADSIGIIIGIVLGKRLPEELIRWISAGIFIFFGFAGTSHILGNRLPLPLSAAVLFVVGVTTLAATHYLIIAYRRTAVRPAGPSQAGGLAVALPQSAYAAMLALAWLAGLGVSPSLAWIDHWITLLFLCGLGWRMIHDAVRNDRASPLDSRRVYGVLILAAATSAQALLVEFHLRLAIVPGLLFLTAIAVILLGPALASRRAGDRITRIAQNRVEVASGLLLFGIALKTLIEHLS